MIIRRLLLIRILNLLFDTFTLFWGCFDHLNIMMMITTIIIMMNPQNDTSNHALIHLCKKQTLNYDLMIMFDGRQAVFWGYAM